MKKVSFVLVGVFFISITAWAINKSELLKLTNQIQSAVDTNYNNLTDQQRGRLYRLLENALDVAQNPGT